MEGFCIDSGWFMDVKENCSILGDWNPSENRFDEYRLEGDYSVYSVQKHDSGIMA